MSAIASVSRRVTRGEGVAQAVSTGSVLDSNPEVSGGFDESSLDGVLDEPDEGSELGEGDGPELLPAGGSAGGFADDVVELEPPVGLEAELPSVSALVALVSVSLGAPSLAGSFEAQADNATPLPINHAAQLHRPNLLVLRRIRRT